MSRDPIKANFSVDKKMKQKNKIVCNNLQNL